MCVQPAYKGGRATLAVVLSQDSSQGSQKQEVVAECSLSQGSSPDSQGSQASCVRRVLSAARQDVERRRDAGSSDYNSNLSSPESSQVIGANCENV